MSEDIDINALIQTLHYKTPSDVLLNTLESLQALSLEDGTCSLLMLEEYHCMDKLLRLLELEDEGVVDTAAAVIANLGGSISRGSTVKKWQFGQWTLPIRELSFAEGDLGYIILL